MVKKESNIEQEDRRASMYSSSYRDFKEMSRAIFNEELKLLIKEEVRKLFMNKDFKKEFKKIVLREIGALLK